jgi:hypothetical protein
MQAANAALEHAQDAVKDVEGTSGWSSTTLKALHDTALKNARVVPAF